MAKTLLFAPPAAGFDQPFEMLHACHDRVERTLDLLMRLEEYLQRHGSDAQAQDAATDVLRYFDLAAPLHHEDEERHVLPVLRAVGQAAIADALQTDHIQMSADWAAIRADLQKIQQHIGLTGAEMEAAGKRWHAFSALYAKHIQREEASAYPEVLRHLSTTQLNAMGQDMATRRGVTHPTFPS